ncbi:MAG: PilT/PilU family type 4a pilus ATPase [Archangium sp.]|nr:PilT/PilU family type 4a pilus ATPase [Archangium sp.]
MKTIPVDKTLSDKLVGALSKNALFHGLNPEQLTSVLAAGQLQQFENKETLTKQGDLSDSFYVILKGEASVRAGAEDTIELGRLKVSDAVGEMGILLDQARSATVIAEGQVLATRFEAKAFHGMFQKIPSFGLATSRMLAARLQKASHQIPLPDFEGSTTPPPEVLSLLPIDFLQRHRVLPLAVEGNVLTLGFVDDPNSQVLSGARQLLPSMELRPVGISSHALDEALGGQGGVKGWSAPVESAAPSEPSATKSSPKLDAMLKRAVAEGASDLHLSAGHKPRWRVDGDMRELADARPLGESEVYELLQPIMAERNKKQFDADNDTDFAYPLPGVARFRVNLFRDHLGVGAVLRQIPDKILTFEMLGLPPVIRALCEHTKGLVLVTGPTGSGKSTTLAAMIDFINRNKKKHIITLEDPIEFVHKSQASLVNQREVGPHTNTFARALKAALREDPDIVLVGEMRDLETVSAALETANTGHLVFGTLHTSTAVSTVDRIIGLFSPEEQPQIRTVVADVLKGVVAQTLLKKSGGGRIAALEILVTTPAVSNLVREGKNHQIASAMSIGKSLGMQMLNEELARLVTEKKVEYEDALAKSLDKPDLAKRLGKTEQAK